MKRLVRTVMIAISGVCALLIVALGFLWVFNPDAATLLAAQVLYTVSSQPTSQPPIAEGQITKEDWLAPQEGSRKVTAVLERRFPVGSRASDLRSALRDQGFAFMDVGFNLPNGAYFHWGNVICQNTLQVEWKTDTRDQIVRIEGRYGNAC